MKSTMDTWAWEVKEEQEIPESFTTFFKSLHHQAGTISLHSLCTTGERLPSKVNPEAFGDLSGSDLYRGKI